MSDVDRERLAVPGAHSVFSQHTNTGSYSGTSIAGGSSCAPPFAPRPHYGQQVRQQQQQRLQHHGSTAASSRSGATTSDRGAAPSAVSGASSSSSTECNIHEVCYYFQQVVFVLAVATGCALVAAGAVLHAQNGELLVLVYIGVLLAAVNSVLLTIQCCVRRKQKRRSARAYRTAHPREPPAGAVVRYDPLSNPLLSSSTAQQTVPAAEVQQYHYKHYHIHAPPPQPSFPDFPVQQGMFVQSPTESAQTRFHHGVPYHRSGSNAGHHRHAKGVPYQKSPPLGQVHRPLLNPLGPQQSNMRSDLCQPDSYKPAVPLPASYEDLIRTGRIPPDSGVVGGSTTVHLI